MSYTVTILRRAQKELAALPQTPIRGFATPSMRWPKTQDHPGREGWRIRVSSYRVIYEIGDAQQTITVLRHLFHLRPRQAIAMLNAVHTHAQRRRCQSLAPQPFSQPIRSVTIARASSSLKFT